jgi:hypothetical protein
MGNNPKKRTFWRTAEFRLALALLAAVMVFVASSDDAGCGNDVGWVRIENRNAYPIKVAISGESGNRSTVTAAHTAVEFRLVPGGYFYFAKDLQNLGKIISGSVSVKAAVTQTITVKF